MATKLKNALVAALTLGIAFSDLATHAFAANTYDSSEWAPIDFGLSGGSEPSATVPKENNADRFASGPRWQLSHKLDRPR